jgi:predicted transcriptional regulator
MKKVVELFKKNPDPETQKITLIQNTQEMPQESKTLETTDRVDSPQIEDLSSSPGVLELLKSLQEMNAEEQKLLEARQHLLTKQQDLQGKLVEEISKKKMAIDVLRSEIPDLQDKIRQLGQVLGIDSS